MKDLGSPQEIANALRELQRTSPTERSDLAAWDASARAFWNAVKIPLPSGVLHYLHDADIRIKDPSYGESQNQMISGIISELESGNVPESTGVTFSIHPRWLGAIALVLATVAWLVISRSAA